jgi:signal transduction histidine kinase
MASEQCHILLVEDEQAHAELIRRAFVQRGGTNSLTVAHTLGEARRRLAKAPLPNLVIADLLLPDGRGTDLLPGNGVEVVYPLVLITGHGDEEAAVVAMKAGAIDYVVKSDVTLADMPRIAERALRYWEHVVERRRAEEALRVYHDRLRALAFELSQAEERQRRQVATFLHDNIAQALTMVRINLDAVRASVSSPDLARALAEVRDLLVQPVSDIRSLTFDLSSPVLYELGFEAALESLVETTQQKHGIPCILENDGKPGLLDDTVEVIVFRAVQELLVNVLKHARAKTVKVSVCHTEDGHMCVSVRDDGIGFDPDAVAGRGAGGFGLFNIRERLKDVGGCLQLESAPRRGTLAVLTVPAIHEPSALSQLKR